MIMSGVILHEEMTEVERRRYAFIVRSLQGRFYAHGVLCRCIMIDKYDFNILE